MTPEQIKTLEDNLAIAIEALRGDITPNEGES